MNVADRGRWVVLMALSLMAACRPTYPNCEKDSDCHAQEFCVARKCQQCRTSSDCAAGMACNAGRCDAIPGYCRDKSQCKPGEECIANQCRPCAADGECPSGSRCVAGHCTDKKSCSKDDDCAQDEDCVNGVCVGGKPAAPPPSECSLSAVYFDFNESALTTDATAALAKDAECLKKVGRGVTLVGHTDPRGTEEYNLALSEKRAQSVKAHLERLGVDGSGGKMTTLPRGMRDAKGSDEPSWAKDRRVDLDWK